MNSPLIPDSVDKLSIEYRGKILHTMTSAENAIDTFMAYFFCGNDEAKAGQLVFTLLSKPQVNLMAKYEAVMYIFKNNYEEIFNENKGVFNGFEKDIQFRNNLAHLHLSINSLVGYKMDGIELSAFTANKTDVKIKKVEVNKSIMDKHIKNIKAFEGILRGKIWEHLTNSRKR